MTGEADTAVEQQHIARPRLEGGRLICPRCDSRLQFDGEEYVCIICGYECPVELVRETERAAYGERRMAPALAVTAILVALGTGAATRAMLGSLGWAAIVGVASALLLGVGVRHASRHGASRRAS